MDYAVYRDPKTLRTTCYIEIGPGLHKGAHWQEGFWFVADDAFRFNEGIVSKHFQAYDSYSVNELPSSIALAISLELRHAASLIESGTEASMVLRLPARLASQLRGELRDNGVAIASMLHAVANALETSATSEDWVCILGL